MASGTKRKMSGSRDLSADWQKIKAALLEAAEDMQGVAGEVVSDSIQDLNDQSAKIQKNISDYTEQKPLKALAIAALVGFVIGYWWRR